MFSAEPTNVGKKNVEGAQSYATLTCSLISKDTCNMVVAVFNDAQTSKSERTLGHLMLFVHGLHATPSYGVDHKDTVEELYAITPYEVVRWMNKHAC